MADLLDPLPMYETVFYHRKIPLHSTVNIVSASYGASSIANYEGIHCPCEWGYYNHILVGCILWYLPRELKPMDVGKNRLVLIQGTRRGRLRGVKLTADTDIKGFSINQPILLPNEGLSHGKKYVIDINVINLNTGQEERWQIMTPSEKDYNNWLEALKKAKNCAECAETNGEAEKLRDLTKKMKEGLVVRKRFSRFKIYARTFVGSRAVKWIMKAKNCSLPQALALGNRMLSLGFIHHVTYEHMFYSRNLLYRFSLEIDPPMAGSFGGALEEDLKILNEEISQENHRLLSQLHLIQRDMSHFKASITEIDVQFVKFQRVLCDFQHKQRKLLQKNQNLQRGLVFLLVLLTILWLALDVRIMSLPTLSFVATILWAAVLLAYLRQLPPKDHATLLENSMLRIQHGLKSLTKEALQVNIIQGDDGAELDLDDGEDVEGDESNDDEEADEELDDDSLSETSGSDDDGLIPEDVQDIPIAAINPLPTTSRSCISSNDSIDLEPDKCDEIITKDTLAPAMNASLGAALSYAKILTKFSQSDQWPNYPILIRRSEDMLRTGLTAPEKEALLQPLPIHRPGPPELSIIPIDNDFFIGKAFLVFDNLPDTNPDHFRYKNNTKSSPVFRVYLSAL